MKVIIVRSPTARVKENPLKHGSAASITAAMEQPPEQPAFIVEDNRLTLLDTGPRRLDALIALIDGAKATLRILYYIYADDDAGRRVTDALIAAAARGVSVALIVDGFGSDDTDPETFDRLRDGGVDTCRFSARFGRRYLLRNHQKLALADAGRAEAKIIVGGFNVEDDYFGTPAEQAWRDLGLLVEGLAASRMSDYFDALQEWVKRERGKLRHLNRALAEFSETSGAMRWLIGGPTRRLSPWARTVRDDMRRATNIDLIAAYFAPSPRMLRRLDERGKRNARVRIVTAGKSDSNATIAAARFTYAGLLRKGVEIFEFAQTKLHTKLYVIDDTVHVGSANFDMRSLFINLELMLRIENKAFADHVRTYVEGEIAKSQPVDRDWYRKHTGIIQRIKQFAAYILIAFVDPGVSRGLNFGIDD
jgi:cardiolipin synthase A/B